MFGDVSFHKPFHLVAWGARLSVWYIQSFVSDSLPYTSSQSLDQGKPH